MHLSVLTGPAQRKGVRKEEEESALRPDAGTGTDTGIDTPLTFVCLNQI